MKFFILPHIYSLHTPFAPLWLWWPHRSGQPVKNQIINDVIHVFFFWGHSYASVKCERNDNDAYCRMMAQIVRPRRLSVYSLHSTRLHNKWLSDGFMPKTGIVWMSWCLGVACKYSTSFECVVTGIFRAPRAAAETEGAMTWHFLFTHHFFIRLEIFQYFLICPTLLSRPNVNNI